MGCSSTNTFSRKNSFTKIEPRGLKNGSKKKNKKHKKNKDYSFDTKMKKAKYENIYKDIDFRDEYREGAQTDSEIILDEDYIESILKIKHKDKKEEIKNKSKESKDSKENNKKSKVGKEENKKKSRYKYEKKLIELEEKTHNLSIKEDKIKEKENKLKKEKEEFKIKKDEYKKDKKNFDKEKKDKLEPLKQKETELNKKEHDIENEENIYFPNKKPILIGLNNIGATCYMNASLQCLSNTKKLTEFFLNNYKEKKKKNHIIAHEYYELINNLWDEKNNNKSYSPNSFKEVLSKENPLFAGIQANDSKDLINFLIERLHQELNIAKENIENINQINQINQMNENEMLKLFTNEFTSQYNSIISKLFYGMLETKSQCKGCNVIKFNFQLYSFLEFPLQQVNQYYFNNGRRPLFTPDGKNPDVDLYECFEYYRKIDLMNGENQMFCNICNKLCDTFYSTTLYSGPNYLIINLNRGRGAVYECKVNFPEQLNIFNFVTYKHGITAYELYAVICHLGPSSDSGHFVAYCRNRIDNKWYLYNDAFVNLCTRPKQYTEGMPYILFYKALKSED